MLALVEMAERPSQLVGPHAVIPSAAFMCTAVSESQIGSAYPLVCNQFLGRPLHGHAPSFHHIASVGDAQRGIRVLLYQTHRDAQRLRITDHIHDLRDQTRRDGLVRNDDVLHHNIGFFKVGATTGRCLPI